MAIHEPCHLIAVVGGKGGVGKSVLSANLAISLLLEMRAPTLLIDLDAHTCGDQNVILGLRPTKTISDLLKITGTMSQKVVKSLVTPHPSGLSFLPSVVRPDQTLLASPELLKKQLYPLSQHFKFIVVDLGTDMGELQMTVLEDANAIILVTVPEILALNQTRKILNQLLANTIPSELFQLVVNKVTRNGLPASTITQNLRRPIIASFPQDEMTAYQSLQSSKPLVLGYPKSPLTQAHHGLSRYLTGGVLQKLKTLTKATGSKTLRKPDQKALPGKTPNAPKTANEVDPRTLLKTQIHHELIKEMDLKKNLGNTEGDPQKEQELRVKTQSVIAQLIDRMEKGLSRSERGEIIKEVLDEALGLGPLEDLLADATVSEIMVNGAKQIYVEKSGKLVLSPTTFTSNLQLRNVIERIMTPLGRRIDEKTPYQDARLADGSRVNAVIEPLSIDGPCLTIRKFPEDRIVINDYYERFGSMTKSMADFLRICVEQHLNIIISGGTGTGKTTLLNCLSSFIPASERIVTIEDAAELQLKQEHIVRLETRPPNMEGTGAIGIRDLVKNSLRMRPDRIIVGECRDGAALDMLSAMNTGHDGSMTTVHSNSPKEAVSRLENLCLMAGMDLPVKAIREQVASAVHLFVQISRLSDGSRKISDITEVVGMQGPAVTLQPIFQFKEEGFDKNRNIIGSFKSTGLIPTFLEKFEQRGVIIPRNLFNSEPNSNPTKTPTRTPSAKLNRPTPLRSTSGLKITKPKKTSGESQ